MIVAPLKTKIVFYVYLIIFEFSDARVVMCKLSNFFPPVYMRYLMIYLMCYETVNR